jgi:Icc-related predicted phosphoesterase
MTLLCLSDIHGEGSGLEAVAAASQDADLIIIAGDVTQRGGRADAERVISPLLASGRRVLALAGNMDREGVGLFLEERGIGIHGKGTVIGEVGFMGLGGSNPTPFGTPFELRAEEEAGLLAKGYLQIAQSRRKVLISHAPPKDTRLDRNFTGLHVGSSEVRKFILSHDIHLCICGHIHEARGEEVLGSALCVNLGPYKNGGYALVRIGEEKPSVEWRQK